MKLSGRVVYIFEQIRIEDNIETPLSAAFDAYDANGKPIQLIE